MAKVRVGVIGCGSWGPNLVRNFYKVEDCEMAAVADLSWLLHHGPSVGKAPVSVSVIGANHID